MDIVNTPAGDQTPKFADLTLKTSTAYPSQLAVADSNLPESPSCDEQEARNTAVGNGKTATAK